MDKQYQPAPPEDYRGVDDPEIQRYLDALRKAEQAPKKQG